MSRVFHFFTATILCGIGGVAGSIAGNAFGMTWLWGGGIVGGLVGASISSWIASQAGWIARERRARATLCTSLGFLAAAVIAVNTLSSPVGPVASTVLAGLGAVLGGGRSPDKNETLT